MGLQAAACAYLGHYYREVAKDLAKAKNCYEETLLLDPQNTAVAHALTQVNRSLNLLLMFGVLGSQLSTG